METKPKTTTTTDVEDGIPIETVAEILGRSERQSQRILKENKVEGFTKTGEGNRKFYAEQEVRRLAARIGCGSGLNPTKHELAVKNTAGAALQRQVEGLQQDRRELQSQLGELNRELGRLQSKAETAARLEKEQEKLERKLDEKEQKNNELQNQLFRLKTQAEASRIIKTNSRLLTVLAVLAAVVVVFFLSPVIASLMRPLFEIISGMLNII